MRCLSRLTLAALSLVLIATACGSGVKQSAVLSSQGEISAAETRLHNLYAAISGSSLERTAGEFVAHHKFQDAIVACMRALGFTYRPPAYTDVWASWAPDSVTAGTRWLAPLKDDPVTGRIQGQVPAAREAAVQESAPGPVLSAAYLAACPSCNNPANGYEEAYHPAGYSQLLTPFYRMFERVDAQLTGAFAGSYASCMTSRGTDNTTYAELVNDIKAHLPEISQIPTPGEAPDSAWQAAKAYESSVASSDKTCRQAAHDLGYSMLVPKLNEFEATYANELVVIREEWRALIAHAKSFGDVPSRLSEYAG